MWDDGNHRDMALHTVCGNIVMIMRVVYGNVKITQSQSAHHHCLNVYLQLQILAALLKLTAVLNISCTLSAAEPLNFSI